MQISNISSLSGVNIVGPTASSYSWTTNEPGGLSPVVYRAFNSIATASNDAGTGTYPSKVGGSEGYDPVEYKYVVGAWDVPGPALYGKTVYTQNDTTAPESGYKVLDIYYPVGLPANTGPCIVQTRGFSGSNHGFLEMSEIYVRTYFKLGGNYWVGNVTNKLYFHRTNDINPGDGNKRSEPYLRLNNSGSGYILELNMQGGPDNNRSDGDWNGGTLTANVSGSNIQKNRWHQLESYLKLDTAVSGSNGIIKVWLDGNLCIDVSDASIISHIDHVWHVVPHISPTFGGSSAPIAPGEDFHLYFDHFYVTGA